MVKSTFFVLAIFFSWYVVNDVYGKQSVESPILLSKPKAYNAEFEIPELTEERIELLRRIAGLQVAGVTSGRVTDKNGSASVLSSENSAELRSTNAEWRSYQSTDKHSGTREGVASSGWAVPTTPLYPADGEPQVALVASCNDEGEKSVYIKMRPDYPIPVNGRIVVTGQVGWDSSDPYDATFSYDAGLNVLRLQAGLEDSLSMIKAGNKVRIQMPWHDDHQVDFEFSLKGSSRALKSAFDHCLSNAG